MRFKNLTITLTLTCLSIVALAGIVILPVTNGICEWSGDDSHKSYYTNSVHKDKQDHEENESHLWSEDTRKGRGWHLSANLSASGWGSSAYVSPAIYGDEPLVAYTEEKTYSGTANVRAWRVNTGMSILCDTCGSYYSYWVGEAEDKNTDVGDSQTIAAQVISKHFVRIFGSEKHKKTGNTIETGVSGTAEVPFAELTVSVGYQWQHESGVTISEDRRESFYKRVKGDSQYQYARIRNLGAAQVLQHGRTPNVQHRIYPANSHAETNFYFEGTHSSNSVSYDFNPNNYYSSTSGSYYYFP